MLVLLISLIITNIRAVDNRVNYIEQIHQLPLVSKENQDSGINIKLAKQDLSLSALYFGIGLCTSKEISKGVPFEIVGLISIAEKLRQTFFAKLSKYECFN